MRMIAPRKFPPPPPSNIARQTSTRRSGLRFVWKGRSAAPAALAAVRRPQPIPSETGNKRARL